MRRDAAEAKFHNGPSCCCSRSMFVAGEEAEGCPSRTGCWAETWRQRLVQESMVLGPGEDLLKEEQTLFLTLRSVGIVCWGIEGKRLERRGKMFFS